LISRRTEFDPEIRMLAAQTAPLPARLSRPLLFLIMNSNKQGIAIMHAK